MLRIQRISEKQGTRLVLSGDLRYDDVNELLVEMAKEGLPATLDLLEVGHVDIDGVRLLNECQAHGVTIAREAPYIREWMRLERRH